jgi:hypothetical protein
MIIASRALLGILKTFLAYSKKRSRLNYCTGPFARRISVQTNTRSEPALLSKSAPMVTLKARPRALLRDLVPNGRLRAGGASSERSAWCA